MLRKRVSPWSVAKAEFVARSGITMQEAGPGLGTSCT